MKERCESTKKKDWEIRHLQLDRKEQRAVYLTQDHWEWLIQKGDGKGSGSATHAIRDLIDSSRHIKTDPET